MKQIARLIGSSVALCLATPTLTACGPLAVNSASTDAAPAVVDICAAARAGLNATPAKARAASMQCLIAAETAFQSAAMLALPFVANGTIPDSAVPRLREINTAMVRALSDAYNAPTAEQRLQLADAIALGTAEILRIIAARSQ
ncbi:hypothetical protein [Sphingomonas sp. SRS2]|uniref:hypothetical protein n=1 Tax=Sphingomonas sp. SRS2 TaxID=133190 RepID=UPI00061843BD|nr:hypothetical protein [Sphingomonas sp. SRS2]KKC27433.1 hypothetical protein WP12_03395 [Sphingomonas sp. SRS2]